MTLAEAPNNPGMPPGQAPVWGGYDGRSGLQRRRGSAGPDPLSQRLLWLAGGLSTLLILIVANSFLHSAENPLNPIARAAQRTQKAPGARFSFRVLYSSPSHPEPISALGEGAYNARTGRSRATLRIPASVFGDIRIDALADRRSIYTRSREIDAELPAGREWLQVQPFLGRSQEAAMVGGGGESSLQLLEAASDDVEDVGPERVRGKPVERYRGHVELAHYGELLAGEGKQQIAAEYERLAERISKPVLIEASIDHHGLVRRTRNVMTIPFGTSGVEVTTDTRSVLFDFGARPRIGLPAPRRVFDATPINRAQLNLFDGGTMARYLRPAAAPSLSPALFRRRAQRVCRSLVSRGRVLVGRAGPQIAELKRAEQLGGAGPRFRAAAAGYALRLYEPLYRLGREGLRRMARISAPAGSAPGWTRIRRLLAVELEMVLAEARGMEVGALAEVKGLPDRRHRLSHRSDAIARRLGLPDCASGSHGQGSGATHSRA